MKLFKRLAAGTLLCCFAAINLGCGGTGGCTTERFPGLVITITDETTGNPICGVDYLVYSNTGLSEQGTTPVNGEYCGRISLLEERSGTFTLQLSKSGYGEWSLENIEILHNSCHVIPIHVEAEMVESD